LTTSNPDTCGLILLATSPTADGLAQEADDYNSSNSSIVNEDAEEETLRQLPKYD
ncbi:hypothetical protein BGX20_011582, partial [Mortierella sp. AD010]